MTILRFLNDILMAFRPCFSRKATFEWFVVIVAGLLARTDSLGVTSVIRGLMLSVDYMGLIGFFRSGAWRLETLTEKWCALVQKTAPLLKHGDAVVLIGDGVKKPKEGRRMPGVKRHHQESGNSAKAEYIWGHLFGGLGIVAEKAGKSFCVPLAMVLHDGVKKIFAWGGDERQDSHVVEMLKLGGIVTKFFKKSILVLDRYFLTVPALNALEAYNAGAAGAAMQIVTKAKCNCKAYHQPENPPGKRGRPRKKGKSVKLLGLFASENDRFVPAKAFMYGGLADVRYYCVDLLWGAGLYKMLRFVLVEYNGSQAILVSTDLGLDPLDIIWLYSKRFSIETTFREMNQVVCAFGYHFWSKYMPRINRFKKKTDPDPIDQVETPKAKERIKLAVKATEGFLFCALVATGLLQMASLQFSGTDELANLRYLRTYRNAIASEGTIADFIKRNFFCLLHRHPDLPMTRIISSKQGNTFDATDSDEVA